MKRRTAGTPASADPETRFLALLERNRGRIGRLCRAFTRSGADLEDLESEVCVQLWRSLPSFGGRSSEDTWLYRVALNTCLLHGRSERSHREGHRALAREPQRAEAEVGTERRHEARQAAERLLAEIRRLDASDRALMTLHLEELPYRRIAEITGLSESNIGVRLHRIKKRLARRLAGGSQREEVADAAR